LDYARHGQHIAGSAFTHYNRLAREKVYMDHNYAQHTGLLGVDDPRIALAKLSYPDENGVLRACEPLPFHAVEDANLLTHWRGRYKWHYMNAEAYHIPFSKAPYKNRQAKLKSAGVPKG
jgi:hypothetical protein